MCLGAAAGTEIPLAPSERPCECIHSLYVCSKWKAIIKLVIDETSKRPSCINSRAYSTSDGLSTLFKIYAVERRGLFSPVVIYSARQRQSSAGIDVNIMLSYRICGHQWYRPSTSDFGIKYYGVTNLSNVAKFANVLTDDGFSV